PARVHAAIMQAAAAHLATQAQAQPAAAATQAHAQPAAAARKPVAEPKASFWDRLRSRWAFPTFATVGAVAVFMVANRVFLNPERSLAPRRAREAPAPPAAPEPAVAEARRTGEAAESDQERTDSRR